jgi:hypothetical protein
VFLSPSLSHATREHCSHIISSRYSSSSIISVTLLISCLSVEGLPLESSNLVLKFSKSLVTDPKFFLLQVRSAPYTRLSVTAIPPRPSLSGAAHQASFISSAKESKRSHIISYRKIHTLWRSQFS